MTYWFEKQAQQNEPMPDNLTEQEALIYSFLRNLYWSLQRGLITAEQAQKEKKKETSNVNVGRIAQDAQWPPNGQ